MTERDDDAVGAVTGGGGYRVRRLIANAGGAVLAALLVAGAALALGGNVPVLGGAAATAPRYRVVTRDVPVLARIGRPPPTGAKAAGGGAVSHRSHRSSATTAVARFGHRQDQRHHQPHEPDPTHTPGPTPAPSAAPAGGYRALVAGTAALAGDLVLARAAAGVAADGSPLDSDDELGALAPGLPADRTAFAVATGAGAPGSAPESASSSPPAATSGTTAAHTPPDGGCALGEPVAAADAQAARVTGLLGPASSSVQTTLERATGTRYALVAHAIVAPPAVVLAEGTPLEISIRFLGPVELTVRAGGTPGSAAVELGATGTDTSAPLIEIRLAGQTTRLAAADVLAGGGRTLRLGGATLVVGGAARAYRGAGDQPPQIAADGTAASAAADALWLTLPGGKQVRLGHVEASVAVPAGGIVCGASYGNP